VEISGAKASVETSTFGLDAVIPMQCAAVRIQLFETKTPLHR